MNNYTLTVDFKNKTILPRGTIKLVEYDYNSTVIKFNFDSEYEKYSKKMNLKYPDGTKMVLLLEDNEIHLGNYLQQSGTYQFEIVAYGDDSKNTNYAIGSFEVREQLVKDNDTEVELDDRLPILDTLINDTTSALNQVNNLDIDIDENSNVTITKKDGSTKTQNIKGENATINGVNTLTIKNGKNIAINQQDDELTIVNTYDDSEIINNIVKNTSDIETINNSLGNYSLITETGSKIDLNINSDYVISLVLKDKNNNTLSTSSIDLPIESMVVNASYSDGSITLELQNGNTISFSVSDLISGLVSENTLNQEITKLDNAKVDKVSGKELSTNDFDNSYKSKLDSLENYDDTELREELESLQQLTEEQETKITELEEETKQLYSNQLSSSEEGETIYLEDSANMTIKDIQLYGKIEQDSTTGKNLFDMDNAELINSSHTNIEKIANGFEVKILTAGTYRWAIATFPNFESLLGKTLTLSFEKKVSSSNTGQIVLYWLSDSNSLVSSISTIKTSPTTITLPSSIPENAAKIGLVFYANVTGTNAVGDYIDYTNIQIEEGSTATDYEPYTGGTASPNPDYPQDIKVVTENVEVNLDNGLHNFNLEIGTISSNTGATALATNQIRTSDYIKYNNYTTLEYSGLGSAILFCYDNSYNYLGRINNNWSWSATNPLEFNVQDNTEYIKIVWKYIDDRKISSIDELTDIKLYSKIQTYPLSLGDIELCQDEYFFKDGDKWYKNNKWGKDIIDENIDIRIQNTGTVNYIYELVSSTKCLQNVNYQFFNKYNSNGIYLSNTVTGALKLNSGIIRMRYGEESTISDLKSKLKEQNLIVYYLLETETNTEITDKTLISQLNDLLKATTYSTVTNIDTEAENLKPIIKLEYYKDLNKVITDLQSMIVDLSTD